MAILNPSFETPEPNANPGEAEDWTHAQSGAIGKRWAGYQAHDTDPVYYGVEQYHGGWGNDGDFIWEFESGSTVALPAETFEDWETPGVDMPFETELDAADRDPADYDVWEDGATTAERENFESLWDNTVPYAKPDAVDVRLFHFREWEDGTAPTYTDPGTGEPSYQIGVATDIVVRLAQWAAILTEFDSTITLTPGTYNVADMVTHLQTVTDAALVAAGAPWGAGDIGWSAAPDGGLRVEITKASYWMILEDPSTNSAWGSLLFTIDSAIHFHPGASTDVLTLAQYTPGLSYEMFDMYWNNYWDEVLFDLRDFIDAHDTVYPITIQAGVNDKITIWYDDLAGATTVGQLTLAPGVYTTAALMAAQLLIQINAWLGAAGPPFAVGDITATDNPGGQVRVINLDPAKNSTQMWFANPASANGWDDLGFTVQDWLAPNVPDPKTRRLPESLGFQLAQYDVVPGPAEPYENFEDNWTTVLP